jgi:hypothetical protein
LTWTAHYILVKDGENKNADLVRGTVKSFDGEKKLLSVTDENNTNWTFKDVDAKFRLNKQDAKIADLRIGDHVLMLVQKAGDKTNLKSVMVERK